MTTRDPKPTVRVIGAGLIGTSIGMGLSGLGWDVTISDAKGEAERLARGLGAGTAPVDGAAPDMVVIAVPPASTADQVLEALRRWPAAVVTDVASVKEPVRAAVDAAGLGARYVGSHPMAGREVSGAGAAQADLFRARPWILCANGAGPAAVALVRAVGEALGADIIEIDAVRHDAAVARLSHAPQVAASAVAAALAGLNPGDIALAGQGLRDVTRIAASEPGMWAEIARLNGSNLRATIAGIVEDLSTVRDAEDIGAALAALMERGRTEVARIPGKHGGKRRDWTEVTFLVPDAPGQLLRLLTEAAELEINVEDLAIEHSPSHPVGLIRLSVDPARATEMVETLSGRGWEIAS